MKSFKKAIGVILCIVMLVSMLSVGSLAANKKEYTIVSPYADVIWEGDDAWGAYKGSLHSHTSYSDADETLPNMVKEYYEQDYDFLANADHGVTGVEWNRHQADQYLYFYHSIPRVHLTDEEFEGITTGTYPLYDGTIRNKKMVCVTGANELNNLTLTKCHVNGYFLPEGIGNGYGGRESGYDQSLKFIEENGGISHINHPGDFLESNKNIDAVSDADNVKYFADLILKYDSCMGMEVFNDRNSTTCYDRILWDNILMYTLPYGKNVIGFSNTDAHDKENIDTSFSVFMMEENNMENIKATMQSGAFFPVTRILRANDVIGPEVDIDVRNMGLTYPMFTRVEVDGHKIIVNTTESQYIQWIANGKIIATSKTDGKPITLDLDKIKGAEDFQYVRAELYGEGGVCLTQALVIDDGSEKLEFQEPTGLDALVKNAVEWFKGTRFWTIIVEIGRL